MPTLSFFMTFKIMSISTIVSEPRLTSTEMNGQKQTVEFVHLEEYKFSAYLHRLIVSCFHSIGRQILNSFHYTKTVNAA